MNIGTTIKELRQQKGITQEAFAETLCVSVQTISRWENGVNYPDLSMLPLLSVYFGVTTDYLLGLEGKDHMPKLLKTTEIFELSSEQEAEEMVLKFKGERFPILKGYKVAASDGKVILEVTKEFNADLDSMKFH